MFFVSGICVFGSAIRLRYILRAELVAIKKRKFKLRSVYSEINSFEVMRRFRRSPVFFSRTQLFSPFLPLRLGSLNEFNRSWRGNLVIAANYQNWLVLPSPVRLAPQEQINDHDNRQI